MTVASGCRRQGQVPATPITTTIPHAYRSTPIRVLLVGDSQALTLGIGLQAALTANPSRYDRIRMLNEGILGLRRRRRDDGDRVGTTFIVGLPCTPDPARRKCPPGGVFGPRQNVPCQEWTSAWKDWVRQLKPNVVVLLAGGGEVLDRVYDGRLTNILNPTFAAYVKSQLEKAVRIATAGGALMVFMTKPCQSTGEQPDGDPWPQDSAARQDVYNSLLRQVAAEAPEPGVRSGSQRYVCPGGKYTEDLNGVPVRQAGRSPLRRPARRRRRLPGTGHPPLLGGARPSSGGTDRWRQCPRWSTSALLRSAVMLIGRSATQAAPNRSS